MVETLRKESCLMQGKFKQGGIGRGSAEPLWICGVNSVREALRSPGMHIEEIVLARSDAVGQELAALGKQRSIPVHYENKEVLLKKVGHSHHQGAAARMDEFPYTSLDVLLERPPAEREPLLVLDSIQDPQNLGALIRSACFLGTKGVVIPKDRSAGVTASVLKVAAGGASYLPIVQVVNLARTLDQMKEAGLWILGMTGAGSQTLYEADLTVPLALVVGNEHTGIRRLVLKHCDLLVAIPRQGPLESLNAAAAGTIALAEVQRQRFRRSGTV